MFGQNTQLSQKDILRRRKIIYLGEPGMAVCPSGVHRVPGAQMCKHVQQCTYLQAQKVSQLYKCQFYENHLFKSSQNRALHETECPFYVQMRASWKNPLQNQRPEGVVQVVKAAENKIAEEDESFLEAAHQQLITELKEEQLQLEQLQQFKIRLRKEGIEKKRNVLLPDRLFNLKLCQDGVTSQQLAILLRVDDSLPDEELQKQFDEMCKRPPNMWRRRFKSNNVTLHDLCTLEQDNTCAIIDCLARVKTQNDFDRRLAGEFLIVSDRSVKFSPQSFWKKFGIAKSVHLTGQQKEEVLILVTAESPQVGRFVYADVALLIFDAREFQSHFLCDYKPVIRTPAKEEDAGGSAIKKVPTPERAVPQLRQRIRCSVIQQQKEHFQKTVRANFENHKLQLVEDHTAKRKTIDEEVSKLSQEIYHRERLFDDSRIKEKARQSELNLRYDTLKKSLAQNIHQQSVNQQGQSIEIYSEKIYEKCFANAQQALKSLMDAQIAAQSAQQKQKMIQLREEQDQITIAYEDLKEQVEKIQGFNKQYLRDIEKLQIEQMQAQVRLVKTTEQLQHYQESIAHNTTESCILCNLQRCQVAHIPCGHVLYCEGCFALMRQLTQIQQCAKCGELVKRNTRVQYQQLELIEQMEEEQDDDI